jgi:hypothetical protein
MTVKFRLNELAVIVAARDARLALAQRPLTSSAETMLTTRAFLLRRKVL